MAQAYSPGLTVTDNIVLKKERILPLKGTVLVKKGDKVKAEDLVAETLLPGKVIPFKLSKKYAKAVYKLPEVRKKESEKKEIEYDYCGFLWLD